MAKIDISWDIEGMLTPQESVEGMLRVIGSKGSAESGSFWTWDGQVRS